MLLFFRKVLITVFDAVPPLFNTDCCGVCLGVQEITLLGKMPSLPSQCHCGHSVSYSWRQVD